MQNAGDSLSAPGIFLCDANTFNPDEWPELSN